MYHYNQSIQNTRGDALIGYFVQAISTTDGTVVPIYADSSSTPIISVSGVANMALVDSDGMASFWIASGEYHLDIYASDAATRIKRVTSIPMQDSAADAAAAAASAASAVALLSGETKTTATYPGAAPALPATPAGYKRITIDGHDYAIPIYNWFAPIDLFIITGQSNADGRGTSAQAPAAPNGTVIIGSTITTPMVDPVGPTSTGDMWPAFSNRYFTETGRNSAFVPAAKGDTALIAAADVNLAGNWSPTGTLRAAAVTAANAAIAAIAASADLTLGTLRFVWCQGERDAESDNGTTINATDYETATEALATYFKAQVPSMLEMVVVGLGNDGITPSRDAQYALYRQAQATACNNSALLRMVCTAGMSMSYRIPQWKGDGLHYTQPAYNQLGAMAAAETATPNAVAFAPSPTVTTSFYTGVAVGSRTVAFTAASTTKSIILANAIGRSGSSTSTISGITFNGKAFRQVQKAGSGYTSAPADTTQASIWILDEDDYAAPLASATGNIVVTYSGTYVVFAAMSIIESAEPLVIEYQDWTFITNAAVTSLSRTALANSPSLMVTVAAGRINSDTPATTTFSSGTEAMDTGYKLDTGRSFTGAAAYEVLSAPTYGLTETVTMSSAMLHLGIVNATFRRRFAGETDVS